MKVSVVTPFYNEENIIVSSTKRMLNNLTHQFSDWELILVNDGSQDNSLQKILDSKDLKNKNLRIISCEINQGRGRALKNGIDFANGDIIVTTEVDCSWGDQIVKNLVNKLLKDNLDVVIASPHAKNGGLKNVPLKRVLLTKLGNILINKFFNSGVSMSTGMTRAYRKEVIKPLFVTENGKEFHLEVLLKLRTMKFRIGEIPAIITWKNIKSTESSKKRKSSTKIKKTIFTHLKFLLSAEPKGIFGILSLLATTIGLIFIIWAFINMLMLKPSILLLILGLQVVVFSFLFAGFSIMFAEIRDISVRGWMNNYQNTKKGIPPSVIEADEIIIRK